MDVAVAIGVGVVEAVPLFEDNGPPKPTHLVIVNGFALHGATSPQHFVAEVR